jgi:hypothetical protein
MPFTGSTSHAAVDLPTDLTCLEKGFQILHGAQYARHSRKVHEKWARIPTRFFPNAARNDVTLPAWMLESGGHGGDSWTGN